MALWTPESHELLRKLLKYEPVDPKAVKRIPDLWFQKIHRYEEVLKYCSQPIAELPWEERVITAKKLNDAYRHDEELLDRLRQESLPYDAAYTAVIQMEIERLKAKRDLLRPQEAADRGQAATRLAVDDSPSGKQRRRYLKEAEQSLTTYLREIREINKSQLKSAALPPPEPSSKPTPTPRNEPNPDPAPPVDESKDQKRPRPNKRILTNLKGTKPPSQRRR